MERMLRILRTTLALVALAIAAPAAAAPPIAPYPAGAAANTVYDQLFSDNAEAFRPVAGKAPAPWQATLFAADPDPAKVNALARDPQTESRVRALAFNWLHAHEKPVPHGEVLGVIVEVPLKDGLDVLAAYADGSVSYINQSSKMSLVEPGAAPDVSRAAQRLVELATPVVAKISPMENGRQPPPKAPSVRITFVVSDGLYFAEGPFEAIQRHPATGPLMGQASNILSKLADMSEK